MKTFRVSLARSYAVTIKAEDKISARELTEFYLGDCSDLSTTVDRNKWNFSVKNIEMTLNEALDTEEITING